MGSDTHLSPEDDDFNHLRGAAVAGLNPAPFDRFYFNVQSPDGALVMILGCGHYDGTGIEDGFCCVSTPTHQINVRFAQSAALGEASHRFGPLRYEIKKPLEHWSLELEDARSPIRFQLNALARLPPCKVDPIRVQHVGRAATHFQHFFQSMQYDGFIAVDGNFSAVKSWVGQRDRSWGVRHTREKLGFHLWAGIHPEGRHIGFNYNEARDHSVSHCDGAVSDKALGAFRVVDVGHDLVFNKDNTRIVRGELVLLLENGNKVFLEVTPHGAAYELAGAGYDGRHGTAVAGRELEIERWDLRSESWSAALTLRVPGQIANFRSGTEIHPGIIEMSITRNQAYRYQSKKL